MSTTPPTTPPLPNFVPVHTEVDKLEQQFADLMTLNSAANDNLRQAATTNNQLQQENARLKAELAAIPPPSPAPAPVKLLTRSYDFDFGGYPLAPAPGPVGNVGATGRTHGSYDGPKQLPDGGDFWTFAPKHLAPDPWDTYFVFSSLVYDPLYLADVTRFIYRVKFRIPPTAPTSGTANFDRIEQLETNWELQLPDYSTLNWGAALNLSGKDGGWKWFNFPDGAHHGWNALNIPTWTDHANLLRLGNDLCITQQLSVVKSPEGKFSASFDCLIINGVGFNVGLLNPATIKPNRLKDKWRPFAQYAWQADAKGDDLPFILVASGQHVDIVYPATASK